MRTKLEFQLMGFCVLLILVIAVCFTVISGNENLVDDQGRQINELIEQNYQLLKDHSELRQQFFNETGHWPDENDLPCPSCPPIPGSVPSNSEPILLPEPISPVPV